MKILIVGSTQSAAPQATLSKARRLIKGFIRNGHDAVAFDYEASLAMHSPIKSKRWYRKLGRRKTDRAMQNLAADYRPDMVFLVGTGILRGETVRQLRQVAPNAIYVCRHEDVQKHVSPKTLDLALECDWFISTAAGRYLQEAKDGGVPNCAFLPNPTDPDLEYPRSVPVKWESDVLFTGKLTHKLAGQDADRESLIQELAESNRLTVHGCLGRPKISGEDYINALCGAKIGLSINAFNDVELYHSDRLTHYLSHGMFVIAKYVPRSELLFEDGKHLRYFQTKDECLELIERYLSDDDARKRIAHAGMERVHSEFNCVRIAKYYVDLATTGSCSESWACIL